MALKDTWTDKLDGIDDVLASDINSIAQSAISLEEKTEIADKKIEELSEKVENQKAPSVELADTLNNDDTDKAPSVHAVNVGLDGMQLSASMDDDFKFTVSLLNAKDEVISMQEIDLPFGEMIKSGKVSDDGDKIILTLKNGQTIEFGVEPIVDGLATKEELEVNKIFVEDSLAPIKRDVANIQAAALGKLYTTREEWVSSVLFNILEGTLPHFYCGDITIYFNSHDGSVSASAQAETITFYDSGNASISTVPISQRYIEIPEGATKIGVDYSDIANANEYPVDYVYTFGQMIFQVKVSGGSVDSGIEAALDNIIDIQNSLIGGDSE